MSSNIEIIREAEARLPGLVAEAESLRQEALADDGIVDAEEQAEIDKVEVKIADLEKLIHERRAAWEANKRRFDEILRNMSSDIGIIDGCYDDTFAGDIQVFKRDLDAAREQAGAEDYAAAIALLEPLVPRGEDLRQRIENAELAGLSDEELAARPLTLIAPEELFTPEAMEELSQREFKGTDPENRPKLADLMKKIERGLSSEERPQVMVELAEVVGEPPSADDLNSDYDRFVILKRQRDTVGDQKGKDDIEGLNDEMHPDFRGSPEQMMFGAVLGDSFGIHEVFASLLSPTGGLVGPGNSLVPEEFGLGFTVDSPHLDPSNPVALHGTVHDAAGYFKSYHDEGPGYNYMESWVEDAFLEVLTACGLGDYDFLTGQISGVIWWSEDSEKGSEWMEANPDYLDQIQEEATKIVCEKVEEQINHAQAAAQQFAQDAADAANDAIQDVEDRVDQAMQDASDMVDQAKQDASDMVDQAVRDASDMVDQAGAALDGVLDGMDIADLVQAGGMTLDDTPIMESYEAASQELGEMSDAVTDKLSAMANYIWS